MSDIYFFTDVDLLEEQTAEQGQEQAKGRAFGPVFGHEDTQYRVTSMHTATSDPNAYAVCDGWIFAQEIDANYISIVLKPFYSNNSYTSQIKYFIYKGIKKSSLIENGFVIESIGTNKKTQSLLEYLNTSYNNYYKVRYGINSGSKNKITESTIGIGLIHKDNEIKETTTLDSIFQRSDIHFFRVKSGLVLGNFDKNNIGFEVVVNDIGESIKLSDIRDIETIIEHNPSENDNDIEARTKKEKILNYIDPCCFYSEFYVLSEDLSYEQVKQLKTVVAASYNNIVQTSHLMTNNDLYAVLHKYATSDIVYLDIRNQYRHSLNYYKNYCQENEEYATIKIGLDGGGFQSMQYKDSFGWPIMRLNVSSFVRENKWKPSSIKIKLPICDNRKPYVGLENGYFGDDYPSVCECLKETSEDTGDIGYTLSIEFAIPKIDITTTIPYHIKIVYYKGIDSIQSDVSGLEPEANHYIDYLFNLNKMVNENGVIIPLKKNNTTQWVTGVENVFVDESAFRGTSYIAQSGIAKDSDIITFFALKNDNKFISGTSNRSFLSEIGDELPYWNEITLSKETIRLSNGGNKATFSSNCLPDSIFTTENSFDLYPDGRDLIQLQISVFELQSIQTAMSQLDSRYDRRLGFHETIDYDENNKEYHIYEIQVMGYTINQDKVQKTTKPTGIRIYRIEENDNSRIYSSEGAILFLPSYDPIEENRQNLQYSILLKDTSLYVRTYPKKTEGNEIIRLKGFVKLMVLGKIIDSDKCIWYYVETEKNNFAEIEKSKCLKETSLAKRYKRGWLRPNTNKDEKYDKVFYPIASLNKFISDLKRLNEKLDEAQEKNGYVRDNIIQRITRIRQRTHENNLMGKFFNIVIGSDSINPKAEYIENIGYEGGDQKIVDGFEIDTNIQLFYDYMGVQIDENLIIDLHHLFVGMDVLNHPDTEGNPNKVLEIKSLLGVVGGITALEIANLPTSFGNNIDATTWAGDLGAIPADYLLKKDSDYQEKNDENFSHYYKTRASDIDILSDIIIHGIHKRQEKIKLTENNRLEDLLYTYFSFVKNFGLSDSIIDFFKYMKIDKEMGVHRNWQPTVYNYIYNSVLNFSKWWRVKSMLSFPISATLLSESDMAQECEEVTRFFMLKLNEYRDRIIEEDGEVF